MPITRASTSGGVIPWRSPTTRGFIVPFNQPARYRISGITRDKDGVALANCTVDVHETESGTLRGSVVSGADGGYSLDVVGTGVDPESGIALTFFVKAYKAGAPDVAGTTVNTLAGSET
jgi:hypothetical protein